MAKELYRRGESLDEIARLCRPSDEEIRLYKQECSQAIRKGSGTIYAPTSHGLTHTKPKPIPRKSLNTAAVVVYVCIFICTLAYCTAL